MSTWSERVMAASLPWHPTEAVGPLLACLDAYIEALRGRGWEAWVTAERGSDPCLRMHAAREGRQSVFLRFQVGRDVLFEEGQPPLAFSSPEALEARLREHARHTGAFAWLAAGAGEPPWDDGVERMEAARLCPGPVSPRPDLRQTLELELEGLERFEPVVDELIGVLDEFTAGVSAKTGLMVWWGRGRPHLSGGLASRVDCAGRVSWAPLHFLIERTGLRRGWPRSERALRHPDELRAHLEEAVGEGEGRALIATLRLSESEPLELVIAGQTVRLAPEQRRALWSALEAGRAADVVVEASDVQALLAALPHRPEVGLGLWGCWMLRPERCQALDERRVRLVGEGRATPSRALLPGHAVAGRSSWSDRIESC
jgi:hypothetical protein